MAQFKVYTGILISAAVANGRYGVAPAQDVTYLFVQRFIIAIQAHVAFAMINDQ